jgi:hypothetical protein
MNPSPSFVEDPSALPATAKLDAGCRDVGPRRARAVTRTLGATALALAVSSTALSSALAAQTIVGTWVDSTEPGSLCIAVAELRIAAMGLTSGEDFSCDFSDVARADDTVTWHGSCTNFGERKADRATVVARLRDKALTVSVNGRSQGVFHRCHE